MIQKYFTIMPTANRALDYIDKFGTERMKYTSFREALHHYDDFKRLQIPDIGIAEVICINGAELLKERKKQGLTKEEIVKEHGQKQEGNMQAGK